MAEATVTGAERIAAAFARRARRGQGGPDALPDGRLPRRSRPRWPSRTPTSRPGADLVELGVPFSDPLADGPVIHAAATRALAGGATLESVLSICERVAGRSRWCRWCTRTWCSRGGRRVRAPARRRRRRGRDRPGPAPRGGGGDRRGAERRGHPAGAAGRSDDARRAPPPDLRASRGFRLRGLRHPGDRRARRAARRPRPSWSPRCAPRHRCRPRSGSGSAPRSRRRRSAGSPTE